MQRKLYVLLSLTAFLFSSVLYAGTQGKIKGKVVDSKSGEALVGATVQIVGTSWGAVTDINGEYTILKAEVGTYTVKASYVGYQAVTISNILVNADLTSEANFKLPLEGVTGQEVVIVAQRPLVNKSATNVTRIVDAQSIANLPTRGVDAVIKLQPGVVQRGTNTYVRGSRPDQTSYFIEGVSINNLYSGGRGVTITDEAVEQIQVQTGGYTAEYPGANGGIITTSIKTGGENWKVSVRAETDNYTSQGKKSLGGYSYGYSDYVVTAGGAIPMTDKKLRFFGSAQNTFFRDTEIRFLEELNFTGTKALPTAANRSVFHPDSIASDTLDLIYQAGNALGAMQNTFVYTGTLLYNLGDLQVKLAGSYNNRESKDPVTLANVFNQSRTPYRTLQDGFGNLKLTYFVTPEIAVEASGNYSYRDSRVMDPFFKNSLNKYGDTTANRKLGFNNFYYSDDVKRNVTLPAWDVYGGTIRFNQPGTIVSGYTKSFVQTMGGKLDVSAQLGKNALKLGGEFTQGTIRRYASISADLVNRFYKVTDATKTKEEIAKELRGTGIDNFGYDAFGTKEIDTDVFSNGRLTDLAARKPIIAGGYIQDKLELSDLNINFGLRYDYLDNDGIVLVEPRNVAIDDSTGLVSKSALKKSIATQQISPRLGFSFPVSDRTVFHAQYGKFISPTKGSDTYQGLAGFTDDIGGGFFVTNVIGFNLKPERSTLYEIGFTQQIAENASFDITTYYKDIQDQITYVQISPLPGAAHGNYAALVNGDFSTTKGVEFKVTLRRINRIEADINYTYSDARATGSTPTSLAGTVAGSQVSDFTPKYIFPVNFNQTHKGSVTLDYRFAKDDGGPVLEQLGLNVLMEFNSGNSYTRLYYTGESIADSRFRTPLELIGESTTPTYFRIDTKLDKTITLGPVDMNIYVYVTNVLNTKNVLVVYPRTGNAYDTGWLSTAEGKTKADNLGEHYVELYNAINNGTNSGHVGGGSATVNATNLNGLAFSGNFDAPRQIVFGVKIVY